MNIEETINSEIKTAMLAKDSKRLEALRAIKSVILLLKTSPEGLTDESVNKALQKEVKKRKESADIYKNQSRPDLEEQELSQAIIMESFLPKQMTEEEIKSELSKIIASVGATGAADMGKVMGALKAKVAGKADGALVSSLVKAALNKWAITRNLNM